jgi:3-deoxy-manno-octulosonate cytidylyltransferase (CMP-KDO synthetase)
VVVATDHENVARVVRGFGGKVVMTPKTCNSGTDRMACVARKEAADYYVNIQGDEPLMNKDAIRKTVELAQRTRAIATAMTDLEKVDYQNPNVVKVVLGEKGRAIYFSRSLIPFPRDGESKLDFFKHLGLYVYPRKDLFKFVSAKPTALENTEKLEQLRALYYGMPIYVTYTKHDSVGVDTKKDLLAVEKRMKQKWERSR